MKNRFAPVLLFAYKKVEPLRKTLATLQSNYLAPATDLYIFSDGPKTDDDVEVISEVRLFLRSITGFGKVVIHEAEKNIGLADSIIGGVSKILKSENRVIVVEDDLILSVNFLDFMNQCLAVYVADEKVFSISGYTPNLKVSTNSDVYFSKRASSWGWGTWKNRWDKIDWEVKDFESFSQNKREKKQFNKIGSDLTGMLQKQMSGKINSWAIRWVYHQFRTGTLTANPTVSKVENIGFGGAATHTFDHVNRYSTSLDSSGNRNFNLPTPFIDEKILKEVRSVHSLYTRAKYKFINHFVKLLK